MSLTINSAFTEGSLSSSAYDFVNAQSRPSLPKAWSPPKEKLLILDIEDLLFNSLAILARFAVPALSVTLLYPEPGVSSSTDLSKRYLNLFLFSISVYVLDIRFKYSLE